MVFTAMSASSEARPLARIACCSRSITGSDNVVIGATACLIACSALSAATGTATGVAAVVAAAIGRWMVLRGACAILRLGGVTGLPSSISGCWCSWQVGLALGMVTVVGVDGGSGRSRRSSRLTSGPVSGCCRSSLGMGGGVVVVDVAGCFSSGVGGVVSLTS